MTSSVPTFDTLTDSDLKDGLVADADGNVCSLDGHVLMCGDPRTAAALVAAFNRSVDQDLRDEASRAANAYESGFREGARWAGAEVQQAQEGGATGQDNRSPADLVEELAKIAWNAGDKHMQSGVHRGRDSRPLVSNTRT